MFNRAFEVINISVSWIAKITLQIVELSENLQIAQSSFEPNFQSVKFPIALDFIWTQSSVTMTSKKLRNFNVNNNVNLSSNLYVK